MMSTLSAASAPAAEWPGAVSSPEFPSALGAWQPVSILGEGTLARVFRARPLGRGDTPASYAVKVLRARWQDDRRAMACFEREALAGVTISHPHVIAVLEAQTAKPPFFLVMPCLSGVTLARWFESRPRPPLAVTLWIIRQIAEALGAVSKHRWMHGDVKPANISVAPDGHATLLDLGTVRRVEESKSLADRPVLGTLRYMAPEMITSTLAGDIRSDIYSLGATFYEMLSGSPPFPGDDPASLAMMHRDTPAPRLERILPDLPAPVTELVHQMLAKEPLRRPQTPGELVEVLTRLEIDYFHSRSWPVRAAAPSAAPAFAKHRASARSNERS